MSMLSRPKTVGCVYKQIKLPIGGLSIKIVKVDGVEILFVNMATGA